MRRTLAFFRSLALAAVAMTLGSAALAAIGATPVKTGLDFPAAFTFDPSGRIFYAERFTGEIRIYNPANGSDTLFFTVTNLETDGERGLLGLALPPGYPSTAFVFAYATRDVAGTPTNQILRIRDAGGTGSNMRVIWTSNVPSGTNHNGGRILFGPDGRLYAFQGEAGNPGNSQITTNNEAGKILRMKSNGAPSGGNPFGNRIWSYGHRNSFGFAFDPQTDFLWESENGPSCNDEVNFIAKGGNYAWGNSETCSTPPSAPNNTNQDGPNPILPEVYYASVIAPTGIVFCTGCGIASAEGKVFLASYNDVRIRQLTLDAARTNVTSQAIVYTHSASPLSMERGPDGAVYFSDDAGIWKLTGS
jgi:glucose/arabinose dehydrogenase